MKKKKKEKLISLFSINRNISFDAVPHGGSLEILVKSNLELCP